VPEWLSAPQEYETFVYALVDEHPDVKRSTLVYIPAGAFFGRVEGMLFFDQGIVLCVQEYLNFELGVIEGYGYELSQPHPSVSDAPFPDAAEYCRPAFPHKEKLYWYDSFPHPNDPALASTDPHHKHVPPDIKHHRVPAPDLSFTRPNLPFLIGEVGQLLRQATD
jgi:hypothetical protein